MGKLYLSIMAVLMSLLCGCMTTPQNQYDVDSGNWPWIKSAVNLATAIHPVTPDVALIIQKNFILGDQNLAEAQLWLNANPQFANTPGMSCPSLVGWHVITDLLNSLIPSANGVTVVTPSDTTPVK